LQFLAHLAADLAEAKLNGLWFSCVFALSVCAGRTENCIRMHFLISLFFDAVLAPRALNMVRNRLDCLTSEHDLSTLYLFVWSISRPGRVT